MFKQQRNSSHRLDPNHRKLVDKIKEGIMSIAKESDDFIRDAGDYLDLEVRKAPFLHEQRIVKGEDGNINIFLKFSGDPDVYFVSLQLIVGDK